MFDPKDIMIRRYLIWTFIMIVFLLASGIAVSGEKVLHSKIQTIEPDKVNGQYCYVKIQIKQNGDTITKEEILECADGKKGIETPGYWDLFAQFYYRDVSTPEYCRYYSRNNHAFKTPGKVCLQQNGEWEVR
mgnify:CR=1 FL=1